jgi:ATP adenylyltransferase
VSSAPEETGSEAGAEPGRDGFDRLWTPHRMAYIKGEGKPADVDADCPFCLMRPENDADALIVARGKYAFAVLNLYPYNAGHLMLVPWRHVASYEQLEPAEANEIAAMTQHAILALKVASNPGGFNVGMNLGVVGGAGIAAHLHQHVVPRWGGDTNFMPVVGQTRVLPQLLPDTRVLLAQAWHDVAPVARD